MVSYFSYSQDYLPMVVEGATWINTYPTAGSSETYFVYHLEGDTIVNNIEYKILNLQDFEIGEDDILRVLDSGIPQALLREDESTEKVYSILLNTFEFISGDLNDFQMSRVQGEYENEYVLYDFSLEEGDIIDAPLPRSISKIEEVEKFDYTVRDYMLDLGGGYYEKIGNPYTLFHPFQFAFIAGAASDVKHYCGHDTIPCTYLTKPLSGDEIITVNFSIYPNPVESIVNFELANNQILSIRLYSPDGRLIQMINDISENNVQVDLSHSNYHGLIYVVYETETSTFSDSFIRI